MTLVDTNVLLDIVADSPVWPDWSMVQLGEARNRGPVVINDVIFAEFSTRFDALSDAVHWCARLDLDHRPIPNAALFCAAKTFIAYRRSGGEKTGVLPDFFIGAHAEVEGFTLLTRDTRRYGTYFPAVTRITPPAAR